MNIKRIVIISALASAGVTAAAFQRADAATIDRTCRSDFIPTAHIQECVSANLVFQAIPTTFPNPPATLMRKSLFVMRVAEGFGNVVGIAWKTRFALTHS